MPRPRFPWIAVILAILSLALAIVAAALLHPLLAAGFLVATALASVIAVSRRGHAATSSALAETTLEAMADAVIRFDLEGRLEYLNPAASQLIGLILDLKEAPRLDQAFRLLDREQRTPLTPALFEDLRHGNVSRLGDQACLVTNEGLELEVDGQCAPILTADRRVAGGVLVLRDVTEIREAQRRHLWLEEHDALTGALNRKTFEDRLARAINSQRAAEYPMSLLHIELDTYKTVKASAGNAAGDELLLQTSRLIRAQVRDSDPIGRLDEAAFGLLLTTCPDEAAMRIARTIYESLTGYRFQWGEQSWPLEVSFGVVPIPPNWETLDRVMAAAQSASALSKASRRVMVHQDGSSA